MVANPRLYLSKVYNDGKREMAQLAALMAAVAAYPKETITGVL